jgi:hypothetical protein
MGNNVELSQHDSLLSMSAQDEDNTEGYSMQELQNVSCCPQLLHFLLAWANLQSMQ